MKPKFAWGALVLSLAFAANASAELVSYQFTGVVDKSGAYGAALGTAVSGLITYDTSTLADVVGPIGTKAQLLHYLVPAPGQLQITIGGDTIASTAMGIVVRDGFSGSNVSDQFTASGSGLRLNGTPMAPENYMDITLATRPNSTSVLGDSLPATLNLADFDAPYFAHYGALFTGSGPDRALTFTIDTLTAVPEPSSMLTGGLGLAMLGGLLRARRKS